MALRPNEGDHVKQTPHCPAGACWRASLPWLLLRMAPVAATALGEAPTKLAAMSDADPIFAAIEQHKEARAAYLGAMDVPGEDREIRAIAGCMPAGRTRRVL